MRLTRRAFATRWPRRPALPADDAPSHLSVAAKPNTRILLIRFAADSSRSAERGSLAAAKALISVRAVELAQARDDELASLARQRQGLEQSINVLAGVHRSTVKIVAALTALDAIQRSVQTADTSGGSIVTMPHDYPQRGTTLVHLITGACVGVLVVIGAGLAAPALRRRPDAIAPGAGGPDRGNEHPDRAASISLQRRLEPARARRTPPRTLSAPIRRH